MALSRLLPVGVDYVLMANTFHGVPNKAALVREVAAVLKPGGRFAVVNWSLCRASGRRCWASRAACAPNCAWPRRLQALA